MRSVSTEFVLVTSLDRMTAWGFEEQLERARVIAQFRFEDGPPVWVLPESTRPLANLASLSAWIDGALPADALG